MDRLKFIPFILIIVLIGCTGFAKSKTLETSDYILYLPNSMDDSIRHPLLIAFSPSANAQEMINTWKGPAEKQKWIILASKKVRNGANLNEILPHLANTLEIISNIHPIDKSKTIVTGFSGGGMTAHYFSFLYPNLWFSKRTN